MFAFDLRFKTVAVLALLLSYLSASQLVGEPRRGFRGFAEHCDAAAVRVIVILRCPCFSFLELGWGHDDDDKDFFHHPSFGLVEEISMYCHCQTSVCQDLWSLSISVRWLDCDPLLSLLKLTSWLTLLLVCVLSLFVSMAAASSSAANTTVDMTAVDEEIEWHSEFEGHGESSDPDFDPADRAENLLGSLHDRMIISMSPIPRLEVFLGWCWLYSVQVRNLSQSLHLFALLASLSRLEHECLGLSRFYGLPPVSEMRLVLHCCKNWFVVQWTCLSTNHHKLWNGRKDNGKVHVWKFGDKHWVRNPQLRLPITVQLYHCPSVSLSTCPANITVKEVTVIITVSNHHLIWHLLAVLESGWPRSCSREVAPKLRGRNRTRFDQATVCKQAVLCHVSLSKVTEWTYGLTIPLDGRLWVVAAHNPKFTRLGQVSNFLSRFSVEAVDWFSHKCL